MNRTSFFRGLVIGLFVSSFLWLGIIYSTNKVIQAVQTSFQEQVIPVDESPIITASFDELLAKQ